MAGGGILANCNNCKEMGELGPLIRDGESFPPGYNS